MEQDVKETTEQDTKPTSELIKEVSSLNDKINSKIADFGKAVETSKLTQIDGRVTALAHNAGAKFEQFDASMKKVVADVNAQAGKIMSHVMALEQTALSISKMLTAISQALIANGHITNDQVMTKLRETEDKLEQDRTDELVKLGILELSTSSDTQSVLILRQEQVLADGTRRLVSDYRAYALADMTDADPMKKDLIGKVAGDIIGAVKEEDNFSFTVKAVYKFKDGGTVSE